MGMTSQLGVLARERGFRCLWAARVVSFLGDAMTTVALVILVAREVGEGTAVAALLFAEVAPRVGSPVAGALADRLERRRLLVICEAGQAGLAATIAWLMPPLPWLLMLVALRGMLATVFQPTGRAAVPQLVVDADLPAANGLLGLGAQGSRAAAPAVAAGLLPLVGAAGVVAIDAATSVAAVAMLATLPRLHAETDNASQFDSSTTSEPHPTANEPTGRRLSVWADTRAGLRALRHLPLAAAIATALFILVAFTGMSNVALPFLAAGILGLGERGTALLFAAPPTGWLLGALTYTAAGHRMATRRWWLIGLLIHPLALVAVGLAAITATVAVDLVLTAAVTALLIASGWGNGIEVPAGDSLLQRAVPARLLGRTMAVVYGGAFLAGGLAFAAGGILVDTTGATITYLLAGTGGTLGALIGRALLNRINPDPPVTNQ